MFKMNKYMEGNPVDNETEYIDQVAGVAWRSVPPLVVEDGSIDDDSTHRVKAAGAERFYLLPNQGIVATLRSGFMRALDPGCKADKTLDGDGLLHPIKICKLPQTYRPIPVDPLIARSNSKRKPLIRPPPGLYCRDPGISVGYR